MAAHTHEKEGRSTPGQERVEEDGRVGPGRVLGGWLGQKMETTAEVEVFNYFLFLFGFKIEYMQIKSK